METSRSGERMPFLAKCFLTSEKGKAFEEGAADIPRADLELQQYGQREKESLCQSGSCGRTSVDHVALGIEEAASA